MRTSQSSRRGILRFAVFGLMLFMLWSAMPVFASETVNFASIENVPGPLWQLLDNHQTVCNDGRATSAFYRIQVRGTWTKRCR